MVVLESYLRDYMKMKTRLYFSNSKHRLQTSVNTRDGVVNALLLTMLVSPHTNPEHTGKPSAALQLFLAGPDDKKTHFRKM